MSVTYDLEKVKISFGHIIKRGLDLILGGLALILFAPVIVLIILAIKLDSPGPVLFRQIRAGLGGKPFTMYKFRTMFVDSDISDLAVRQSDPRVTRLGHWLRSFSLDELPQLANVLKGEMSLVGPRPLLPSQVDKFNAQERKRLRTLPGMTNLPAIKGRNSLTWQERIRLDTWYVENWSIWLDLEILLKTPWFVLQRSGVYAAREEDKSKVG